MLALKKITVGYGGKIIIEGLSANFSPGRVYALLGKNGCGKTTLLKACANMLPLSCGEILLNGKNISKYPPIERAREMSYLPQHRDIPHITVERLVMHGRHPHMSNLKQPRDVDRAKVAEAMEVMRIEEFKNQPVGLLSGGERQRVYLAMLLAQDAPVMLLDEPGTYMDIAAQLSLLKYMRHLAKAGKLIITVLHNITGALETADEILVMDGGKIIKAGRPDEIMGSAALNDVFGIDADAHIRGDRTYFSLKLKEDY